MDKATQTMIENLLKNTGKTLEEWIQKNYLPGKFNTHQFNHVQK